MPGRTWIGGDKYRYSHNGQEREDEIYTNAQSAEYWMYDSRIIRRWNIDPLTHDDQSPYACFNNNPIYYADPLGLEGEEGGSEGAGKSEPMAAETYTKTPSQGVEGNDVQKAYLKDHPDYVSDGHGGVLRGGGNGGTKSGDSKIPDIHKDPAPRDNTNIPNDNINRTTSSSGKGYGNLWEAIDGYFEEQQNKSEITTPVKTNFYGVQPTTTSGPTKNLGFSSEHATPENADGINGWLPGATLNGPSAGKLAGTGQKGSYLFKTDGETVTGFFNSSLGAGGGLGDGFSSNSPGNKPAIKVVSKDSVVKKSPGTQENPTNDTLYLIYEKGKPADAKHVKLGTTTIK